MVTLLFTPSLNYDSPILPPGPHSLAFPFSFFPFICLSVYLSVCVYFVCLRVCVRVYLRIRECTHDATNWLDLRLHLYLAAETFISYTCVLRSVFFSIK